MSINNACVYNNFIRNCASFYLNSHINLSLTYKIPSTFHRIRKTLEIIAELPSKQGLLFVADSDAFKEWKKAAFKKGQPPAVRGPMDIRELIQRMKVINDHYKKMLTFMRLAFPQSPIS